MNEFNFKTWNDRDLTFNQQTKLTFAQCDKNGHLTWSELLRLTSDGAVEDFGMRGMGWKFLMENEIFFVVSRSSYHIIKMPAAEQFITLQTWEEIAQGPLTTRRYKIIDTQSGEVLITGFSLFIIINSKTRRLIPAKNFTMRPAPIRTSEYDGITPGKITIPENMTQLGIHKVVFSDLDSNGHTNNSKYLNFVIDSLPETFQNQTFKDLRINYSKEAHLNETINILANINEDSKKITILGLINTENCFEAELYF